MKCPVCKKNMETEIYKGVEIEKCHDHGVWLDKGELEKVSKNSDNSFTGSGLLDVVIGGFLF